MMLNFLKFSIWLLALPSALAAPRHDHSTNYTIKDTFAILEEGEKEINAWGTKNYTVVLGVTGSGKSTLIQFLVGGDLIAVAEEDDFIINDEGHKRIGNDVFNSKTLYPEITQDSETNKFLVDCPGFRDTRGPTMDIAVNYFMKNVLDRATSINLVFTTPHTSVHKARANRHAFRDLLTFGAKLITNIDNFNESIALAVTKVDSKETNPNVRGYISNFITASVQDLEKQWNGSNNTNVLIERKIKLAKIFLQEGKIGLFRMPYEAGPLSESSRMNSSKVMLRDVIFGEKLKYAPAVEKDFGYHLSDNSKIYITEELLPKLNGYLERNLTNVVSELENDMVGFLTKNDNDTQVRKEIQNRIHEIMAFTSGNVNAESYSVQVSSFRKHLSSDFNKLNADSITNMAQKVSVLQLFAETGIKYDLHSFLLFGDFLQRVINWHEFLADMNLRFSQYDVIRDRKKYNVEDLIFWGNSDAVAAKGIKITANNVNDFIQLASNFAFAKHTDILKTILRNETVSDFVLTSINKVLSGTIKTKLHYFCNEPNNITIYSKFIVFSELPDLNEIAKKCVHEVKNINLLGFKSVFLDVDVNYPGKQLTIISPTWEVIGSRIISVNGLPGKPHADSKASDRFSYGKGHDGNPGKPGEPAGNFLGIGKFFQNEENLTILAVGGQGGKGQDGGTGSDAEDCEYPDNPYVDRSKDKKGLLMNSVSFEEFVDRSLRRENPPYYIVHCKGYIRHANDNEWCRQHGDEYEELKTGSFVTGFMSLIGERLRFPFYNKKRLFYFTSSSGRAAAAGGRGGKSGLGGVGGKISVIALGGQEKSSKISRPGDVGAIGAGGAGGAGARQNCRRKSIPNYTFISADTIYLRWETVGFDSDVGPQGSRGEDNSNVEQQEQPKPSDTFISSATNTMLFRKMFRNYKVEDRMQMNNFIVALRRTRDEYDFIADLVSNEIQPIQMLGLTFKAYDSNFPQIYAS